MKKITLFIALMMTSLVFSQNLITNGDFEAGTTGWSGNAANVVTENGNSYNSANVTIAGNPWDVNLSYVLPLTTQGKAYKLTFNAWSDVNRVLIAGIGLNQDPWTNVTQTVNLTTTSQPFVLNFISNFASPTSRIIFDMGNATGFVGIDNVVLEEVTTTCNNGVQDGDETGIDCGGSCAPCVAAPTTAAPTPPNRNPSDVISLYSGAYANVASNFDAGWCGASSVQEVTIASNPTVAWKDNPCQGIVLDSGIDASSFTNLHVDVYIAAGTDLTSSVFNLKFVQQPGGAASEINFSVASTPALVAGSWIQIDVPVDLATFTGFKEFGITSNLNNKLWYDNLYAYKGTALGTNKFETSSVKMYPNPVKNTLTIEANSEIQRVSVYNILGQEVLKASPKSNTTTLQINELRKGVYMVTTEIDGNVSTSKVIKE
jgi:endoglucanase